MKKTLNIEEIANKINKLTSGGRKKKEIEVCHYCGWVGLRKDADRIYVPGKNNKDFL